MADPPIWQVCILLMHLFLCLFVGWLVVSWITQKVVDEFS